MGSQIRLLYPHDNRWGGQEFLRGFGRFTRIQYLHHTRSRFGLFPPYGYTPETYNYVKKTGIIHVKVSRLTRALARYPLFGWGSKSHVSAIRWGVCWALAVRRRLGRRYIHICAYDCDPWV